VSTASYEFLGYVVIEYNQASHWPKLLPYGDLHDTAEEAEERAEWERNQARRNGRGEEFRVARVELAVP
jgi:hypothetical protein